MEKASRLTWQRIIIFKLIRDQKSILWITVIVDALLARQRGDSGYGDASVAKKITVIEIFIISWTNDEGPRKYSFGIKGVEHLLASLGFGNLLCCCPAWCRAPPGPWGCHWHPTLPLSPAAATRNHNIIHNNELGIPTSIPNAGCFGQEELPTIIFWDRDWSNLQFVFMFGSRTLCVTKNFPTEQLYFHFFRHLKPSINDTNYPHHSSKKILFGIQANGRRQNRAGNEGNRSIIYRNRPPQWGSNCHSCNLF